ncbi:MAG: ABC transporter ATP-binding protein [Deltaproteobacteria bacterium]|nr:ABC transporter ATP-binding protein [Deltaproteobacteria bacterium]MBW1817081.1 ABC transporter ATP-binding protein [Deltaproteobacteria bacterium]MBW2284202.1 ABC transporter ATP-binding protein [Deltaproteobacteria bacterium]
MAGVNGEPILEIKDLSLTFGGVQALNEINLTIEKGDVFGIIGPNGAGKTSLLNCISGVYHPQEGNVLYKGQMINHIVPHKRAAMGIGRTFQHVELFRGMTVLENIKLGRHQRMPEAFFSSLFRVGKGLKMEMKCRVEIEEMVMDFLDLSAVRWKPVGLLPQGLQKRVDLGRALALEPQLLLLDEPMAGMSVEEKEDMASFMIDVHRDLGITVVWIEHDLKTVRDLSNKVCVLNFGVKIAEGDFREIREDPQVKEAYLGMEG